MTLSIDREARRLAQIRSRDEMIRQLLYLVISLGLIVIVLALMILTVGSP